MLIGILGDIESDYFSKLLISQINNNLKNVKAEFFKISPIKMDFVSPYKVIIDRLSHKLHFYRIYLKNASINYRTFVINNPFWMEVDDRFFDYGVMKIKGVNIPKTVCLPSKSYPQNIESEDLKNLIYPLNWEELVGYIGFPMVMKSQKHNNDVVYLVKNFDEMLYVYNQSGTEVMLLQEYINTNNYIRSFVIGQKYVLITKYNSDTKTYCESDLDKKTLEEIKLTSIKICEILGYEINMIEFAIIDNKFYVIDINNPIPDFNIQEIYLNEIIEYTIRTINGLIKKYF